MRPSRCASSLAREVQVCLFSLTAFIFVGHANASHKSARRINFMRLVFPTRIRTALFAGLLLGGLAVAVAQPPSDQSAPPQSAPQTDQQAPQTAPPADQQTAPQADQQPAAQSASPADNTKLNERDRNANEPTADRQKDNRSDREITQQVRKAIVKDKSLSTYAHNVKVITQNGMTSAYTELLPRFFHTHMRLM